MFHPVVYKTVIHKSSHIYSQILNGLHIVNTQEMLAILLKGNIRGSNFLLSSLWKSIVMTEPETAEWQEKKYAHSQ